MKTAVKIGTISWRSAEALAADEVEFIGEWVYAADSITSLMVWDDTLGNAREMTQAEKDALPGQMATEQAQQEKAEATKGVDDAFQQYGNRVERIVMAVATSAMEGFSNDRETFQAMRTAVQTATTLNDLRAKFAAIQIPAPVTLQFLSDTVKLKVSETPE